MSGGAGDAVGGAAPFVVVAIVAALLIFSLALVPAYVVPWYRVPWYRVSMVLEDHRGEFTLVAGMTLVGAAIAFALAFLS